MKNFYFKRAACIFSVIGFLMTASCGYQFEGGGYLNDTISKVSVILLENQTTEIGADLTFTNALIEEIIAKSDTSVVDEASATAVLKGVVKTISFSTLSRSSAENVLERRISATLDVQLVNKDEEVVWSVKNFTTTEDYTVSEDQLTDDGNKRAALEEIAARTAEKLVSKLLTNF